MNALADYNFSLHYKPGPENVVADMLSRNPIDSSSMITVKAEEVSVIMSSVETSDKETDVQVAVLRATMEEEEKRNVFYDRNHQKSY